MSTQTQTDTVPTPNPPGVGAHRNASSDGPASTGRAVSARNATTHGLFARDVVLPTLGEDPAAFDALLVQLCTQLPPRNMLERHYLEQIAAASWRLRRLHRWQAQVYEDPAIDEDARLDKLDKTLRHESMLTRQIDRAVRLLHRDLSDLFADRAREDTLGKLGRTEAECRRHPEIAALAERIARRSVQDAAATPLMADIDPEQLDTAVMPQAYNVHAPTPSENCENEKCENEPPAPEPVHTVGAHRNAPTLNGNAPNDAQNCQNGPPAPETKAQPPATVPNPPTLGGPQRSGEAGSHGPDYLQHCFLTAQRYRHKKNCQNEPPSPMPPL